MECHPGFSGYVQAVGAIAALALAIFIPWWENHNAALRAKAQRRADDARAAKRVVSILTGLFGEMVALQAEIDRARARLHAQMLNRPQVEYRQWFREIRLVIPTELQASLLQIAELEIPAAEAVVDAISKARNYNGHVARYETAAQNVAGQDWFDVVQAMGTTLDMVEADVTKYFDALEPSK